MILFVEVEYISSDKFNNDYPQLFDMFDFEINRIDGTSYIKKFFALRKIDLRYREEFYTLLDGFFLKHRSNKYIKNIYLSLSLVNKAFVYYYNTNPNVKYYIEKIEFV